MFIQSSLDGELSDPLYDSVNSKIGAVFKYFSVLICCTTKHHFTDDVMNFIIRHVESSANFSLVFACFVLNIMHRHIR